MPGTKQIRSGRVIRLLSDLKKRLEYFDSLEDTEAMRARKLELAFVITEIEEQFSDLINESPHNK